MNKEKITQIFNTLPELNPPSNFKFLILQKIKKAEQKKMMRNLIVLRLAIGISFLTFIAASYYGGKELFASEFWNIVMLGFSDFGLVLSNWQSFAWSLLETLPVSAILILLSPILILMILGRGYENSASVNKFKYSSI